LLDLVENAILLVDFLDDSDKFYGYCSLLEQHTQD
jgi:hypothetical protein